MRTKAFFGAIGRGTRSAAIFVGKKIADAYLAIDPDVRKHVADLPLFAPMMLGSREVPITALPADGKRPVVCVHGLSGHPQNFFGLRLFLRLLGRTRFYAFGYDDSLPLEKSAADLAGAVAEIVRVNDLQSDAKIDLVAHSMGGIVARLALLDPQFASRIETFITIASPHGGTLAARFLATPRALDLRPDSVLWKRLSDQTPWPGPPRYPRLIAFWSSSDVMMLPATTATLQGADNREVNNVSHTGYLTRPRVLRQICAALDEHP
jgi:pimeloyl-ACP methyl ester carboxylesterase